MHRQTGFSLVELSIVLVILGLLTGGILAGQSLIRAAEIRAGGAEYSRYSAALYSFSDKYFQFPGDMNTATKFWGVQHATPATCQTTASTSALTCDGDGNGQVGDGIYEAFRFWQHLANAGLIEGTYTGVAGPGGNYNSIPGTNVPKSRVNNASWYASYMGNFAGTTAIYAADYGHVWWFGTVGSGTNIRPQQAIFTPAEAWNIDTKWDDGKPGTGKILMKGTTYAFGDPLACTTSATSVDYSGAYNLSANNVVCSLMIKF